MKHFIWVAVFCFFTWPTKADEGMWMVNTLDSSQYINMKQLGLSLSLDQLYSSSQASLKDAVVQFDGGCTGVTVSNSGLILTNHHCGLDAIQSQSSVEHNYLQDGFVAQSLSEELPIRGMQVSYLAYTHDFSERILSSVQSIQDERERFFAIDSLIQHLQDSVNALNRFNDAQIHPFYNNNAYFLQVYHQFTDVRLVLAPPSSVGKFGGDTDNWMWPRHTGDFSVFRVYANVENQPTDFSEDNIPYTPAYYAPLSLSGYRKGSYTMTLGYPGSTDRYLSSWGVEQKYQNENIPRIKARGSKLALWDEAMQTDEYTKIQYAAKYARSANYWKYSIGMNKGIERTGLIEKKREQERAFTTWLNSRTDRKEKWGEALSLLEQGYTASAKQRNAFAYLVETLFEGAEILTMITNIMHFDVTDSLSNQVEYIEQTILAPYADYNAQVDELLLSKMMYLAKENIPEEYLPAVFKQIDKKYKGKYEKYCSDAFKHSVMPSLEKLLAAFKNKKGSLIFEKDPLYVLAQSCREAVLTLYADQAEAQAAIVKGERLYMQGLLAMAQENNTRLAPDANFTMRLSYGSVGGYSPYDGAWYNYYTTPAGIFEKYKKNDEEFYVQEEILQLLNQKEEYAAYTNEEGQLPLCFISNNDITGGNSGSPVFNHKGEVLGLAFDGNWESMSGDILFEKEVQKTISVDIRYILFMIDKWGKCDRLLEEMQLN